MTFEERMQLNELQQRYTTRWHEWNALQQALAEAEQNNDRTTKKLHGLAWVASRYYGDELRAVLRGGGLTSPDDIADALLRAITAGAIQDNPNAPLTYTELRADYHRIHEQRNLALTSEQEARQLVEEAAADLDGLQALAHGYFNTALVSPVVGFRRVA